MENQMRLRATQPKIQEYCQFMAKVLSFPESTKQISITSLAIEKDLAGMKDCRTFASSSRPLSRLMAYSLEWTMGVVPTSGDKFERRYSYFLGR